MPAEITTKAALQTYLINLAKRDLRAAASGKLFAIGSVQGPLSVEYTAATRTYKVSTRDSLPMTREEYMKHGQIVPARVLVEGKLSDAAAVLARQYQVNGVPADWLVWD